MEYEMIIDDNKMVTVNNGKISENSDMLGWQESIFGFLMLPNGENRNYFLAKPISRKEAKNLDINAASLLRT